MELLPQYQRDLVGARSAATSPVATARSCRSARVAQRRRRPPGPLTVNHSGQMPSVTLSFNLAPGVSLGTAVDRRAAIWRARRCRRAITTSFAGHGAGVPGGAAGAAGAPGPRDLRHLPRARHPLRELHPPAHDSLGAAVRRRSARCWRCSSSSVDLSVYALRRHHHADRHRQEERDHDDRLRHRGGAAGRQDSRDCDPRGGERPLPADHDDDGGGADGHAADRARLRARARSRAGRWASRWWAASRSRSSSRSTSRRWCTPTSTRSSTGWVGERSARSWSRGGRSRPPVRRGPNQSP